MFIYLVRPHAYVKMWMNEYITVSPLDVAPNSVSCNFFRMANQTQMFSMCGTFNFTTISCTEKCRTIQKQFMCVCATSPKVANMAYLRGDCPAKCLCAVGYVMTEKYTTVYSSLHLSHIILFGFFFGTLLTSRITIVIHIYTHTF